MKPQFKKLYINLKKPIVFYKNEINLINKLTIKNVLNSIKFKILDKKKGFF